MDDLAAMKTSLSALLETHGIPGASVGLIAGDRIETLAIGTSNVRSQQDVIPGMVYRLASVTKPMVATAVMQLAAVGIVDLDAPVSEWFGRHGRPRWFREVTPRHLSSHSAGIDCEVPFNLRRLGNGPTALEQAIDAFDRVEQWSKAGNVMSYANTGYWLLGRILELATKATFEAAMNDLVFRPTGMDDACFDSTRAILYPVAIGHRIGPDGPTPVRTFAYPRARRPSGGVIASVESVLRFAQWHLDATNDVATQMRRQTIGMRRIDQDGWGLGWTLRSAEDGQVIVGHGGSFDGYKTQLTLVPGQTFGIAILTNSDRGNMAIRDIERMLLQHVAGVRLATPRPVELDDLDRFEGEYTQPHATIRVVRDDDALVLHSRSRTLNLTEQSEEQSRFAPLDDSTFIGVSGPQRGAKIDFIFEPDARHPSGLRTGLRVARRT